MILSGQCSKSAYIYVVHAHISTQAGPNGFADPDIRIIFCYIVLYIVIYVLYIYVLYLAEPFKGACRRE